MGKTESLNRSDAEYLLINQSEMSHLEEAASSTIDVINQGMYRKLQPQWM